MELTSEKSCCSAGNNQVDEQAGITQHRWQLSCFHLHHLSFLNVDMSSQPVSCLSFPFCKNRRGEKWTESWDLGRRGKKAKPTPKTNVFVSWEYGSIATLPDRAALLAGLAPGASAHWTVGNLPSAPGAPCQCQRVLLCVWYPALPISQIPRSQIGRAHV